MGAWFRKSDQGWLISIHAQPGAKKSEVVGLHGDALKIRIASPPLDGRANAALIVFLAKALGVARTAVSLEHGAGSRRKTLRIAVPEVDPASLLKYKS